MRRAISLIALVLLTSCGIGEAGLGLPLKRAGETYPGTRLELAGTITFSENGCPMVVVDGVRFYALWPRGEQNGDRIRLSSSEELGEGDAFRARAAFTPVDPLVADPNGFWAHAIGYCAPDDDELLVLDSVEPG